MIFQVFIFIIVKNKSQDNSFQENAEKGVDEILQNKLVYKLY